MFRSFGLPSTVVLIRNLPIERKRRNVKGREWSQVEKKHGVERRSNRETGKLRFFAAVLRIRKQKPEKARRVIRTCLRRSSANKKVCPDLFY